jgi:hypothetical protein
MKWNWQQTDWPHFSYDPAKIEEGEKRLLLGAGLLFGAFKHLGDEDKRQLTIELISNEALKTSEIEGEYLDRDSLQSSIECLAFLCIISILTSICLLPRNGSLASAWSRIPPRLYAATKTTNIPKARMTTSNAPTAPGQAWN